MVSQTIHDVKELNLGIYIAEGGKARAIEIRGEGKQGISATFFLDDDIDFEGMLDGLRRDIIVAYQKELKRTVEAQEATEHEVPADECGANHEQ